MRSTLSMTRRKESVSWNPHSYQLKAIKFGISRGGALFLLDPGLGKTSISLAIVSLLMQQELLPGRVLVIAPLRVCHLVWPAELQKWLDFRHLSMGVLHGPSKESELQKRNDIDVVNPDGLEWLLGATVKKKMVKGRDGQLHERVSVEVDMARVKALGYSMLIVDEITQFKNTNSQRFKMLKKAVNTFDRRYGLTGTPASNGLQDLFGQVYIVDGGRALGPYVTHFRKEFFDVDDYAHSCTPKEGAEERIYELLRPIALRMEAADYIDMPALITTPDTDILVDLPPSVQKRYDEMEQFFITELLDGSKVTAVNAAVKSGKLRQIASGGLFKQHDANGMPVTGAGWENMHMAKIDALQELVESLPGRPILVGYEYQHDLDRLQKRFGKDLPYIAGGVSMKRTKELETEWNKGRLHILAAHPRSVGHGLNLQEAANVVAWLTTTWDLELLDQFIRRIWRQGNAAKHVFNYHILMRNTIEEAVMLALHSKAKTQKALLDALKDYAVEKKKTFARR